MFDRIKRYITLQHARFRRVFLVIIPLVAVALIILASLPLDLISSKWGNQFTQAAVLLLLVVLVEHVANSTDRFQALEGSVDNLETSVGQIRASLGVRESIEIYNRDYAASRKQREFVHNRNPEKARLCEYSSNTVADLIWDLNEVGTTQSVELLICHPDKAVNTWQTGHILDRMSTLANRIDVEQAQGMGLQIKCYENPASLRGRLIDDELVVVGLYTHDRRSHLSTDQQIWGAENPVVITFRSNPYGAIVADWFNEVFDRLWKDAVPLQQAWTNHHANHPIDTRWLQRVSPQS